MANDSFTMVLLTLPMSLYGGPARSARELFMMVSFPLPASSSCQSHLRYPQALPKVLFTLSVSFLMEVVLVLLSGLLSGPAWELTMLPMSSSCEHTVLSMSLSRELVVLSVSFTHGCCATHEPLYGGCLGCPWVFSIVFPANSSCESWCRL